VIRLQFVCGSDLGSRLISWYGQGYRGWSHVDAILPDGSLLGARSDVIGGKPAGVQIRPPAYEKVNRRAIMELPATTLQSEAWESFLRSQIGHGYDKSDILGFILGRPMMQAGNWICSAVQLDALEVSRRMPMLPALTPQQCPPNMLAAILQALGASYREYAS
jgi:hypothetical protein